MQDNAIREESYQNLIVWQKATDFADAVYDVADAWPRDEGRGMVAQVRRAVVSIPTNIAEGQGRTGPREFLHHLSISYGSLCEVETLLPFARRRRYIDEATLRRLMQQSMEVSRLLKGLTRSLRRSQNA